VSVEVSLSKSYVHKGEPVEMRVSVFNGSFLPAAAPETPIQVGERLICKSENPKIESVPAKSGALRIYDYTANSWGKKEIAVEDCIAHDLLGLFSITVEFTNFKGEVKVYPELFTPETNELAVALQSEASETEEDAAEGIRSEPGYEHRPYEAGDPLKLINWKYSAKRDALLVRKLDYSGCNEFIFLLHPFHPENMQANRTKHEERLVEGFLANLLTMRRLFLKCEAYCYLNGAWYNFAIKGMDDILLLQEALCHFQFMHDAPPLPAALNAEASFTVFTCCPEIAANAEAVCPYPAAAGGAWVIGEKYDIFQGG
jgi:hypothetical protein